MADSINQVRLRVLPSVHVKEGKSEEERHVKTSNPASDAAVKVLTTNSETVSTLKRLTGVESVSTRTDVAKANQEASRTRLKDVQTLASAIADDVRDLDGVDGLLKDLPDGFSVAVSSYLSSKN